MAADEGAGLVLYFGPTEDIEASDAAAFLQSRFPASIVVGCSTASGILDNNIEEAGIVAMVCRFDHTTLRLVDTTLRDATDAARAGHELGQALRADNLAGAILLSGGIDVNGSALASSMAAALGPDIPLSGGLAGDGARFLRTIVGSGDKARSGLAVAIGLYGNAIRLSHGSAGGWTPFGPRRRITASDGCLLTELDGRPALELYQRYLGEEAAGLPGSALLYPLLIWNPQAPEQTIVRTVFSIDAARGSVTFAGDMPQGWGAQLMRGSFERLVDGAAEAGQQAQANFPQPISGDILALLVSCVGRRSALGQRTNEELRAVATSLPPGTRCIGFYSHGEITPGVALGQALLQNQTMTITLMAEAA